MVIVVMSYRQAVLRILRNPSITGCRELMSTARCKINAWFPTIIFTKTLSWALTQYVKYSLFNLRLFKDCWLHTRWNTTWAELRLEWRVTRKSPGFSSAGRPSWSWPSSLSKWNSVVCCVNSYNSKNKIQLNLNLNLNIAEKRKWYCESNFK